MKQKIVKKYIRQIKQIYRGKYRDKKQFTLELQDALLCFCEEHPDASYSDLVNEFGKPSEMKDLLSFQSGEKLQKRNMFMYWTVIGIIIIAVSILLFFTIRHVVNKYNSAHEGYFIEKFFDGDTPTNNVNPLSGETDPPLDNHVDFEEHVAD